VRRRGREAERVRVCAWRRDGGVGGETSADGGGLGFRQTILVRWISNMWTVKMASTEDLWERISEF
jgi:hypothetical protein